MLKVRSISRSFVFVVGFMLMSSGVAHSQTAASSDLVGRWRSPAFTERTGYGRKINANGEVTDTFVARTTILLQRDSTWLSYTTFRVRNNEQSYHSILVNSGGAWRRNGDTLWLAEDAKWYNAAIAYMPDGEAVVRDTLKMRPQPAATAWRPYRATLRDQRLSVRPFGTTDTSAASEPLVCGTGEDQLVVNYDRLRCPGVYDRRTASTP